MKKILTLLCAGIIACSVSACGGAVTKTDTNDVESSSKVETTQPTEQEPNAVDKES